MDREAWERVRAIFEGALELSEAQREAHVARACDGDEALRAEVAGLLAAHRAAGAFLSTPAAESAPDLAGRRIGPYLIEGEIGRGGMGSVYRAVRDDDVFRRTVAIKVVRDGSPEIHRRLEEERRILGRLSHPGIAAIVDGGRTDDGAPYLVMDFVDGEQLDAYCAARRLALRARLELFRTVCAAVAYAHRNLIVHRDLKPANILVTAAGEPRVVDFGIAKRLVGNPADATATLVPAMTPAYASPEQVRGEPITTATDVYSLGVVLYELLTGRRPVEPTGGSLSDAMRSICENEPALPSAAARQAAAAPVPSSALAGDLDTIVMKALAKEPERRYASVDAFAEDVRRHLEGLPVRARADTLGYRARKFVRRHRAAVGGAALLLASLIAGVITTARQARIAERERARADRRFAEARVLARAFIEDVDARIEHLAGATPARRAIVEKGLAYLDGLAAEAGADSGLEVEIAAGYNRIGDILGNPDQPNLGDPPGARTAYDKAAAVARGVLARDPDHMLGRYRLWAALIRIGTLESFTHGPTAALRTLREASAVSDAAIAAHPEDANTARTRQVTQGLVARFQLAAGDRDAARGGFQRARDASIAFRQAHPEDPDASRDVLISYLELGLFELEGDRPAEAVPEFAAALAMAETAARAAPDNGQARRDVALGLHFLGRALLDAGRTADALPVLTRSLEANRALAAADPQSLLGSRDVLSALSHLGRALEKAGRTDDALARYRESLALAETMAAAKPEDRQARSDLATALRHVGEVETAQGRAADAARMLRRAREVQEAVVAADPGDAAAKSSLDEIVAAQQAAAR